MRDEECADADRELLLPLNVAEMGGDAVERQLAEAEARGTWVWLRPAQVAMEPAGFRSALAQRGSPAAGGVVLASGGSQGGRSLCLQPWSHLDRSAAACGQWLLTTGLDPAQVMLLNPLPLHHVSGLMPWWRSRRWGTVHHRLAPALLKQPSALLAACQMLPGWAQKPAVVSLVPTQLKRLMDHPDGVAWLQHLALVWVGGALLPSALADRARALGVRLAPCYGATETAAMVACQRPEQFLAGESGCGSPLSDVEFCLDAHGTLKVRTQRLALARWRTGAWCSLADPEGWWLTGDAARLTDGESGTEQRLQILGRQDGAILSGGETVFPEELAHRLLVQAEGHGLGLEAVLFLPVASAEWGQRLVALVRPKALGSPAPGWPGVERQLREIVSGWISAERPMAWHHCAELAPTAEGKWPRAHWQRWLQSQQSGHAPFLDDDVV